MKLTKTQKILAGVGVLLLVLVIAGGGMVPDPTNTNICGRHYVTTGVITQNSLSPLDNLNIGGYTTSVGGACCDVLSFDTAAYIPGLESEGYVSVTIGTQTAKTNVFKVFINNQRTDEIKMCVRDGTQGLHIKLFEGTNMVDDRTDAYFKVTP